MRMPRVSIAGAMGEVPMTFHYIIVSTFSIVAATTGGHAARRLGATHAPTDATH